VNKKRLSIPVLFGWVALISSCGSDNTAGGTPTPTPTPVSSITLTLTGSGVSPKTATVSEGAEVTFLNSDSVSHDMASDPHPMHTDCPELNGSTIGPSGSRSVTMASRSETCGFHDHLNPGTAAFQGTITVQ